MLITLILYGLAFFVLLLCLAACWGRQEGLIETVVSLRIRIEALEKEVLRLENDWHKEPEKELKKRKKTMWGVIE